MKNRPADLEDLHNPGTSQAGQEELRRHAAVRSFGRRDLAAPTLDYRRRVLYVGTSMANIDVPDSGSSDAVIAFDLDTGKRRWSTQLLAKDQNCGEIGRPMPSARSIAPGTYRNPNDDVSGSPVLYTLPNGRQILIAGREREDHGTDPDDSGAVLWVAQAGDGVWPQGSGMGAAADGELYYRPLAVCSAGAAEEFVGIQCDTDETGAMVALRPATGERVWSTTHAKPTNCSDPEATWCSSGLFGAATVIPALFSQEQGMAPCARTRRGTARSCGNTTHARVRDGERCASQGGSIGGHGPAIVGGMLFMGSGYNITLTAPGNVLLAFGVE